MLILVDLENTGVYFDHKTESVIRVKKPRFGGSVPWFFLPVTLISFFISLSFIEIFTTVYGSILYSFIYILVFVVLDRLWHQAIRKKVKEAIDKRGLNELRLEELEWLEGVILANPAAESYSAVAAIPYVLFVLAGLMTLSMLFYEANTSLGMFLIINCVAPAVYSVYVMKKRERMNVLKIIQNRINQLGGTPVLAISERKRLRISKKEK